jgi:hypothetical protein
MKKSSRLELLRRKEELNKKLQIFNQPGHTKPVTRRDFLSAGVIPFAAYMAAPSLLNIFAGLNQAVGAECAVAASGPQPYPFLHINLSGGMAMGANWVPGDSAGNPLASYNSTGLGASPRLVQDFGGARFFRSDDNSVLNVNNNSGTQSFFYTGILSVTNAATRANTAFVGVATRSGDDTSNNTFSATGMVMKGGLVGGLLPGLGVRNSATGVNQNFSKIRPSAPLIVTRYEDIAGALSVATTGALGSLSAAQRLSALRVINNLNASQVRRLASLNRGAELSNVLECAGIKNIDLTANGPGGTPTDIRTSAIARPVWDPLGTNASNSRGTVLGSIVMNAVNGNAGAAAIELGGYDYHDNTRTNGDQKDFEAGQLVGRALETARLLNRSIFIHVTSDGAVRANPSATPGPWVSDGGERGAAYILAYNPTARPNLVAPAGRNPSQIGAYTAGQVVDTSTVVGTPELSSAAVFANWAKLSTGNTAMIERVIPGTFSSAQLTDILRF